MHLLHFGCFFLISDYAAHAHSLADLFWQPLS